METKLDSKVIAENLRNRIATFMRERPDEDVAPVFGLKLDLTWEQMQFLYTMLFTPAGTLGKLLRPVGKFDTPCLYAVVGKNCRIKPFFSAGEFDTPCLFRAVWKQS